MAANQLCVVLIVILISCALGQWDINNVVRDASPVEKYPDSNHHNTPIDYSDTLPEWQHLVSFVQQKINDMEILLAERNGRIGELELKVASQTIEIKELKQETTSLRQGMTQKDEMVEKLVKIVANLETSVRSDLTQDYHDISHLSMPDNKEHNSGSNYSKETSFRSRFNPAYRNENTILDISQQQFESDNSTLVEESEDKIRHMGQSEDSSISKVSVNQQKASIPTSLQQTVAFHVFLTKDTWVVDDDVVMYDQVDLDHGDGYKPRLGIYVTPESGTYVISWSIYCYGQELFRTLLLVNGSIKGSSWTDSELSKDIHQSSATVVVDLNQGDHVFVRMGPIFGNATILSRNDLALSTFSGWKLD
ncbi:uncharacterized protein [Argopecten irradians]|uniref:uncharacterized protein n=1 Tax=Argopecten irradians TaxID=31199 RepID=UPI003714DF80